MKKCLALCLAAVLLLTGLSGCAKIGSAAENAAETVKKEMEQKIRDTLEQYQVDMVEMKTAVGNLNGDSFLTVQFFGAILLRTKTEEYAQRCANALDKVFEETGYMLQTEQQVTHEYLKNKELFYDQTDFSDWTYYTVYVYSTAISLDGK